MTRAKPHKLRKQYHARRVGADTHIWDVHRLIRAARLLPICATPLSDIAELDENWWYDGPDAAPTPRSIADHIALIERADLRHPIILCADGRLMDGMHRVVKAIAAGRTHIDAVRFDTTPAPDHINTPLSTLPYEDDWV